MSYTVSDFEQDLEALLHGTTLNQITNLVALENRAARQLLLDLDPQETKRTVEFVNPIFNSVFDYPLADDVKGNKLIDIFPSVQRLPLDIWSQDYNQAFDVAKQNILATANMFTMNFNTGIKSIRINAPYLNPPVIINNIDSISNNGTWAVGGTASNLSVNNMNFAQSNGSLQFDTTTGAGYIQNSTMSAVDLSNVENQSSLFLWVYVPTGSSLDSVTLQWGSSSSDYYHYNVAENQQGNNFVNGWNLLQFIWDSNITGTPDPSSITYAKVILNTNADMTACKVNGLDSILGTILNYSYYSKFLFRNAVTGAFQETVSDVSNIINLDTESYNLFTYLGAYYAVQQQQGLDGLFFDSTFFKSSYDEGVAKYKAMYKSEVQKPQSVYYKKPDTTYRNLIGRNW